MGIIVLIILIIINAFFVASEMAFINLNDIYIANEAKKGNKKAIKIYNMLNQPSKFLSTIQIGITFAGFLSSALASDAYASVIAPFMHKIIPLFSLEIWNAISIVIITIILSVFMLLFGELIPKRIAMKHHEKIAYSTINIISIFYYIVSPFVKFLTKTTNSISKLFGVNEKEELQVTEEEIRLMVDHGEEKGVIKKYEKDFINNIFEFNDKYVKDIVKKKEEVVSIDINMHKDEIFKRLSSLDYRYSRIPVYEKDFDNIIGILYMKDLLKSLNKKSFNIKSAIKPAVFIGENKKINVAFKKLQKEKVGMAIVTNSLKEAIGIITIEDILEELVGNIIDEYGN